MTALSIWGFTASRTMSAPAAASALAGHRGDAVALAELPAPLLARMAADHRRGLDEVASQQSGEHRLGDHPGADDGDAGAVQAGVVHSCGTIQGRAGSALHELLTGTGPWPVR